MKCDGCGLNLSGFDASCKVGSLVYYVCPRCSAVNTFCFGCDVPGMNFSIKTESVTKYADLLDAVKEGLRIIAPAVAIAGVWDLTVAYESFKRVLENLESSAVLGPWKDPRYASLRIEKRAFSEDGVALLDNLMSGLTSITPAVVRYSFIHGDISPLRALAHLVSVVNSVKKSVLRGVIGLVPMENYDRFYSTEPFMGEKTWQTDI